LGLLALVEQLGLAVTAQHRYFLQFPQPVELAVMAAAMAVHLEIVLRGEITFLLILPAMVAAEAGQLRRVKTVV